MAEKSKLAKEFLGEDHDLMVCQSNAGYYIGAWDDMGPVSRDSVEYYPTREAAQEALDKGTWTQRPNP